MIVIIFDVSEKIDDFVQKEAPLRAIVVDYYLNFIPYFMNMYSPMVVFLTVILFTSRWRRTPRSSPSSPAGSVSTG